MGRAERKDPKVEHGPVPNGITRAGRRLWERLAQLRREGLSQVLVVLMISFTLFLLATLLARVAISSWSAYYAAIGTQIRMSTARGEPRQDLEYPALISSVLAPVNGDSANWVPSAFDAVGADNVEAIHHTFYVLARQALLLRARQASADRALAEADLRDVESGRRPLLVALGNDAATLQSSFIESTRRHTLDVMRGGSQALERVGNFDSARVGKRVAREGSITTEKHEPIDRPQMVSSLHIPQFIHPERQVGEQAALVRFSDEDLHIAIAVSRFLEEAITRAESAGSMKARSPEEHISIKQAYFISSHSMLRIWPPRPDPTELPLNRPWAGAHYFQLFFERDAEGRCDYTSPAYLDVGGKGVVQTHVRVLHDLHRADTSGVLGILCVDYQLPPERFLRALAFQNTLFRIARFSLPPHAELESIPRDTSFKFMVSEPELGRRRDSTLVWRREADTDLAGAIRDYGADRHREFETRTFSRLPIDGGTRLSRHLLRETFIFPFLSDGSNRQTYLVLAVDPPQLPAEVAASALLALLCMVAGIGLMLQSGVLSGHADEQMSKDIYLRHLPIGVLELDERGGIAGANQAAEWLLATCLVQHGEQRQVASDERVLYRDLMENWVIVLHAHGRLERRLLAEHILRDRRLGRTSTYYGVVRETQHVVKVTGSPSLSGPQASTEFEKWLALSPLSREEEAEIRAEFHKQDDPDPKRPTEASS